MVRIWCNCSDVQLLAILNKTLKFILTMTIFEYAMHIILRHEGYTGIRTDQESNLITITIVLLYSLNGKHPRYTYLGNSNSSQQQSFNITTNSVSEHDSLIYTIFCESLNVVASSAPRYQFLLQLGLPFRSECRAEKNNTPTMPTTRHLW